MTRLLIAAAFIACLAAGCDRDSKARATGDAEGDLQALPRPQADGGSVTGFDGTGPAPAPSAAADPPADDPALPGFDEQVASLDPDGEATIIGTGASGMPGDAGDPAARVPATAPPPPATQQAEAPGPGAAEAAAVVRSYYAAINAGQYPRAYALWADGGRASGQTAGQFAGGFSDTARVGMSTGAPGRVEGAAGSRYVTIPVAVEAVRDDGTIHHYDGTYTLRRSTVDGATPGQRQWRIESADLREVE